MTTLHLSRGGARAALATAVRRVELLDPLPPDADLGFEMSDAIVMCTECALAAGELRSARRFAERSRDLPMHHEIAHVGQARLILVTALSGDWDVMLTAADRFRESWERAGRPLLATLRRSAAAAAAVHGMRGDGPARDAWTDIVVALTATDKRRQGDARAHELLEAMLHLHQGRAQDAVEALPAEPADFRTWGEGCWLQWYGAARAEAAVLAGAPGAAALVPAMVELAADNAVASAVADRAAALLAGDTAGVLATAERFARAGCRYQQARSLVLAGDPGAAAAMAELGATYVH